MYITAGLLDALLERAADAEPDGVTIALAATAAGDLDGADALEPTAPVLTHLYLPSAGRPVRAVFGVDLSTSPGRTHARFVSHPDGTLALTRSDDLHARVIVAVPPWERDDAAVFDRAGRRDDLDVVDAIPHTETPP